MNEGEGGGKEKEERGEAKSGTRPLHLGGTSGETEAGLRNVKGAARRKRDKLSSSKRKAARARFL